MTFVDEDGQVLFDNPAGFPEDVGFTIRELAKNEEWEALDNIAQRLANCEQRLKCYKDLEEQNKLLKLPCAVGDMVYYCYDENKIAPMRVEEIIIAKYGTALLLDYCGDNEQLKHWKINIESTAIDCKIIFLTREEAEAALKELERGKGND